MLGMHMGRVPSPKGSAGANLPDHDTEYWLLRINRASLAANAEAGLLDRALARRIRAGLDDMEREAGEKDAVRDELYITFEPKLLKRCGMEASVLHVGRSSQDILATANAALNLEHLLWLGDAVREVLDALLDAARREKDAVVPAYTNGVQAQPTYWSHYLLAQSEVFGRDAERIFECRGRFDRSPMGSCVLNGTGWPLPAERIAELLGFSAVAANAFDAGQCAGNDLPLEASQIAASLMIHVSSFIADFMPQYSNPRPWILIESANGIYRSSAMPQKRNPGIVNDCRRDAGLVIGEAQGVMMRLMNLPLGMPDARDARSMAALLEDAAVVLRTLAGIIRSLRVNHERALEELNADWTSTQEIADQLVRRGGLDFRRAHGFASAFVTEAKKTGLTPATASRDAFESIWGTFRANEEKSDLPATFPLSAEDLAAALDPKVILAHRATPGSASPSEIEKGFIRAENRIRDISARTETAIAEARKSEARLEAALAAL
ncbi:lyase family protein [Sutterella seckii]|uniref:argininosuccinate lyase n=1 Tax=Sutterella seckii TaxID=1944635 RepID=A0A6I1EIT3_9BURK|nr:lyase family protein [Sutterella seckii]KAB7656697.1 arginase [Sutterella seckii]